MIILGVCSISILSTCIFAAFSSRIAASLSRSLCYLLFVLIFNPSLAFLSAILYIFTDVFYSLSLVVWNQHTGDQKYSRSASQDSLCSSIPKRL